jgi:hypothetical protein
LGETRARVADVAEVWREHRRWSNTANRLKRSIEFWRGAALGLAILGAVLATVASQSGQGTSWARWTSGLAAVALALVPVIRGAKLGRSAVEAWTRARSASEALKSAAYLYCTRAPPYAGEDRDLELRRGANPIVADVGDLEGHTLGAPDSDKPVPTVTDVTSYVVSRVQPQIDTYYRVRAAQLQSDSGCSGAPSTPWPCWRPAALTALATTYTVAMGRPVTTQRMWLDSVDFRL